jgi:hypothetical protein
LASFSIEPPLAQARLASGGSTTRSGAEIGGRRDDAAKHARFVVGTQLNIAQLSDNIDDLAACDLSSLPAGWPPGDRCNRGFCFLTPIEPGQKYEQYYTRFHADIANLSSNEDRGMVGWTDDSIAA